MKIEKLEYYSSSKGGYIWERHPNIDDITDKINEIIDKLNERDNAEPVRHGHWIMLHKTHNVDEDSDYDWRCSECGHVDCHNINVEVPYCWYCGAKMDLDEVEK